MRLTRRGRIVGGALAGIFLWAVFFGIQALNALVLSGGIALIGSWLLVRRAAPPRLRRRTIEPAVAGEARTIEMTVQVPPSLSARVVDVLPDDVRNTSDDDHTVRDGVASYTAIADRRGVHTIGPAAVEISDPLGLVVNVTETTETTDFMAYPRIYPMTGIERGAEALLDGAPTRDRHEFDQLREYRRGDAVRDIDWKSSAKRAADPLVVKEFVSETAAGNALIVATSEPGGSDAMASAAASLACHLLDQGMAVALQTADETVVDAAGETHRRAILAALARTHGGPVEPDRRDSASILVEADGSGTVQVTMGGGRRPFDSMTNAERPAAATDGGWDR